MKTIAGITFSEKGILIERQYQENPQVLAARRIAEEKFTGEFVKIAKYLAKERMNHCYKQLHANLAQATHITETEIAWSKGHFQVPVYEALEAIANITDVRDLDLLQSQQLVRTMLLHNNGWAYNYDSNWNRIEKESAYCTDEFKNFITEHMIVLVTERKGE